MLIGLFVLGLISVVKAAITFDVPIEYSEQIIVSYYFRTDNDKVSVISNQQGLQITVDADISEVCSILDSGMVVYSVDGSTENTLLSWNQYDVFHIVDDNGDAISWSSTNAQGCPVPELASSSVASSIATSSIHGSSSVKESTTTLTGTITSSSVFSASSTSVPVAPSVKLSTVTSTVNGVTTEYTTFCPYATIVSAERFVTYAKEVTKTAGGQKSIFTSYFPVATQNSATATATGKQAPTVAPITTVTTTISGTVFIYTTECPETSRITSEEKTMSVVTSTVSGTATIYTTWYPASSVATSAPLSATSFKTSGSTSPSTSAVASPALLISSVKPQNGTVSTTTFATYQGSAPIVAMNPVLKYVVILAGSFFLA